jgi:hypothetical protein
MQHGEWSVPPLRGRTQGSLAPSSGQSTGSRRCSRCSATCRRAALSCGWSTRRTRSRRGRSRRLHARCFVDSWARRDITSPCMSRLLTCGARPSRMHMNIVLLAVTRGTLPGPQLCMLKTVLRINAADAHSLGAWGTFPSAPPAMSAGTRPASEVWPAVRWLIRERRS